ncbi:PTS sugar transporter subunit IIA, partial [bacterium]|nr:PTS sugar transporter subunit IIA [bacterium]
MQQLKNAIHNGHFILDLVASDLNTAIEATVKKMVEDGILAEAVSENVCNALLKREQLAPTTIGHGVAVPHVYVEGITTQDVVFVRLNHPLNMGAPDGIPTQFVFFLLGPAGAAAAHLDTLAGIARLMSDDEFRYEIGIAKNVSEIEQALHRFETRAEPELAPTQSDISEGLT